MTISGPGSGLSGLRALLRRGRGTALCVHGPVGIGKSYQVTAALNALPLRTFMVAGNAALPALLTAVPACGREPEWAAPLGQPGAVLADHAGQVAALLASRLAGRAPAVLVVEDVQSCGPDALALWSALARLARERRGIGVVLVTQGKPVPQTEAVLVTPLDAASSAALVRAAVPGEVPEPLLEWVFARAQGHPLFTLELLRHLRRRGALRLADEGVVRWEAPSQLELPVTVEGLVQSLLPAGLTPGEWSWLARALLSVELQDAPPAALLDAGVAQLIDGKVDGKAQLPHPLYRQALLPAVPAEALHGALEELVRRGTLNPALGAGLLERLPVSAETACLVLQAAAQDAVDRGDRTHAAAYWQALARRLPLRERHVPLWKASQALNWHGGPLARDLALEALTLKALTQDTALEEWEWVMTLHASTPDPPELVLAQLPPQAAADWRTALLEHHALRRVVSTQVNVEHAQVIGRWEALSVEVQGRASSRVLLSYGLALGYAGRLSDAEQMLALAAQRAPDLTARLSAQTNLGTLAWQRGQYAAGETLLRQVMKTSADVSDAAMRHYIRNVAHFTWALCRVRTTAQAADLEGARQAAQREMEAGELLDYAESQTTLAEVELLLGQPQAARHALMEALEVQFPHGARASLGALAGLVELYADWPQEHSPALLRHFTAQLGRALSAVAEERVSVGKVAGAGDEGPARAWADVVAREPLLARPLLCWVLGLARCGEVTLAARVLGQVQAAALGSETRPLASFAAWVTAILCAEQGQTDQSTVWLERALKLAHSHGDALGEARFAAWARRQRTVVALPPLRGNVTLNVLGPVEVWANGGRLTSRLGVRLLAALLTARLTGETGRSVLELLELLWPDVDERGARRSLRRLVGRVRAHLGAASVVWDEELLTLGEVLSDAEAYLRSGDVSLWHGPFLNGESPDATAEAARAVLLGALEAQVHGCWHQPEVAVLAAQWLRLSEPLDTRLLGLHLRALDALGQPRRAAALYRQARAEFLEVGEALPHDWAEFLRRVTAPLPEVALVPGQGSAARQAREAQVHRATVGRWQRGEVQRPGHVGRPPRLSAEQVAQVRSWQGCGERATLTQLAAQVKTNFGVQLSRAQLSRLLRAGSE